MKALTLAACFFAALAAAACDPNLSPAARQVGDHIAAAEDAQIEAIQVEDLDGIMDVYAPDAVLMMPGVALEGIEPIRANFATLFEDANGALVVSREQVIVASAGDYGITEGTYTLTYTNPEANAPETQTGYYLAVWRMQDDDSWKIIRDVVTPGPIAPPAP